MRATLFHRFSVMIVGAPPHRGVQRPRRGPVSQFECQSCGCSFLRAVVVLRFLYEVQYDSYTSLWLVSSKILTYCRATAQALVAPALYSFRPPSTVPAEEIATRRRALSQCQSIYPNFLILADLEWRQPTPHVNGTAASLEWREFKPTNLTWSQPRPTSHGQTHGDSTNLERPT